jgi:hypothetical protein
MVMAAVDRGGGGAPGFLRPKLVSESQGRVWSPDAGSPRYSTSNTKTKVTFLPLDTAVCALLKEDTAAMTPGAFTESEFIKAWGPTPADLRDRIARWAELVGTDVAPRGEDA